MKTTLVICLAAFLCSFAAQAQSRHIILSTNILAAGTNAAPATNIVNTSFGTGDSKEIGFGFSLQLAAATGTSSNITVTVQKTIDGTNWNFLATCILAASGTTETAFWTNFSVGGIPELRINTALNANTSAVSTITFWRSIKREF